MIKCYNCGDVISSADIGATANTIRVRFADCKCNEKMLFFYSETGELEDVKKVVFGREKKEFKIRTLEPQQLKCVHCNEIILTPVVDFRKKGELIKRSFCSWCSKPIEFHILVSGVGIDIACKAEMELGIVIVDVLGMSRLWIGKTTAHFEDKMVGISATTKVVVKERNEMYIARCGIAIMGSTNFESSIGANPFDENFHDNYVEGKGKTKEEAVENLKKDYESMGNSLWAK